MSDQSTNAKKEDQTDILDRAIKIFPWLMIVIIVTLLAIYFSKFNDGLGDQSQFGAFGDFLGGILNPLLTFFTVVLLIRQLYYQRQELGATVEELQKTAAIHKENIQHNRAVEIHEKTFGEFKLSLKNVDEAISRPFAALNPNGRLVSREVVENFPSTSFKHIFSLYSLGDDLKLISDEIINSQDFTSFNLECENALFGLIHRIEDVNNIAREYERLEVNKLLYLRIYKITISRGRRILILLNTLQFKSEAFDYFKTLIESSENLIKQVEKNTNPD